MDVSAADTSEPRARQLRDEPQSVRYPTREYQQRQPSLERGAADQMDLKHEGHGKSVLVKRTHDDEAGVVCPVDRRQPYQRPSISRGPSCACRPSAASACWTALHFLKRLLGLPLRQRAMAIQKRRCEQPSQFLSGTLPPTYPAWLIPINHTTLSGSTGSPPVVHAIVT